MKRIVASLTIYLCAVVLVCAQEHLSFMGIPINGSMTSFCQKLRAKGFAKIGSQNSITTFSGIFTGREAFIGVAATDDGKNVYSVVVMFNKVNDWKDLVSTYDHYKNLYIRKYGATSYSQEYNPSRYDSNILMMAELSQGTVEYESLWSLPGGVIKLAIDKSDTQYGYGVVVITYLNTINREIKLQNDLNDI